MSRLTIKNSDGSYSQQTHTTFEKMFYKLADLEDVLEEFGIESAEELRERLAMAIVLPNFEKGQEVFVIRKNEVVKANFQDFSKWVEAEVVYNPKTTIYDDGFVDVDYDFDMVDYKMVFATEAEAQAKLDEIRSKNGKRNN